ncbi:calcium-binding protein [Planobispora siamensis]|uniref:Hemolysin-type calcium-binding repeat-containing protein n=1 Tax=Planobispora siamensis TaxID=936338 RepID=A0A8J3SKI1_9ACTN|nr:calcium-binding protein [Planobispora siamensis]GIH93984.1 hypothetical protein Psi01_46140 [Planobispora siamensis]
MARKSIIGALLSVAALTLAGTQALPAAAATAFVDAGTCTFNAASGELRYTAADGIDNEVTIELENNNVFIRDGAGDVVAGAGCIAAGNDARRPAGTVTRIHVAAGDGDDSVRVTALKRAVLRGGDGEDDLRGAGVADDIRGGADNDDLRGGGGNDTVFGNGGDDDMFGNAGNDELNGGAGNDNMSGGAGNDELNGNAGDDELNGNAGTDDLSGGAGTDSCNGGAGTDTETNCE